MKYTKKTHPREYRIWCAMKSRCYAPCNVNMGHYQDLGIQVCDRWRRSFQSFMEDMGECPDGYSIDRIDGRGNYEPENCRWATSKQQANNTTTNHILEWNGEKLTMSQWADKTGIDARVISDRIGRGWDVEKTLTTPVKR